jgi:hypothetical protein
VWTSASAPPLSSMLFVAGTDQGIVSINKETWDLDWIISKSTKRSPQRHLSDCLALSFLQHDPNTLLAGNRTGHVDFIDLRNPSIGDDAIRHSAPVSHIKQISEYGILVNGLRSSMCQYDIRYRKHSFKSFARKRTTPFITYPEHNSGAYIQLGFDIDIDAGLVAAAQEDKTVQLFSIRDGKKLKYVDMNLKAEEPVRCVKFVDESRDGGHTKALWVARESAIQGYRW